MAEMGSDLVLDHGLDQCRWMGERIARSSDMLANGQVALVATNSLLSSELTMGIIASLHPVSLLKSSQRDTDGLELQESTLAAIPRVHRLYTWGVCD
jgi:hypothetical protein